MSGTRARDAWREQLACTSSGGIKSSYGNLCLILRNTFRDRLTFNEMAAAPCLDGAAVADATIGRVREELERSFGATFSETNTAAGLRQIAEESSFHPVRRYLESLTWDEQPRIDRVGVELLGLEGTELELSMLRRFLVGCVARAMSPGCKLDTCLVLVGPQGYRKSTFFDVLASPWFSDTAMDISTRQGLLQLAAAWIYEWGELETVTSRKQVSEVKAFISSREDKFVPPYGRGIVRHRRTTVIVGSTNEEQFLIDPTGSRRFWVLRVRRRIDVATLRAWKDQIWAEAVTEWLKGIPWWLEEDEEREREELAATYQIEDAWDQPVISWLVQWAEKPRDPRRYPADALTTSAILQGALGLEPARQDPAGQRRLGALMRRLGYENPKMWIGESSARRNVRVWRQVDQAEPCPEVDATSESVEGEYARA